MYTIKDLVSDKFILLNEANLVEVEGVKSISVSFIADKRKKVTVHIGLLELLFGSTLKSVIEQRIRKDLTVNFDLKFGI